MAREDNPEKNGGRYRLDEQRRMFLKASMVGALGGSSLPLLSENAAGSTVINSPSGSALYEEDFEDIPLGDAPSDWTVDDDHTPFAIYRVEEGGAAGSQRAFHVKTDPFQGHTNEDGTEDWASVVYTPHIDAPVSEIEWYWKKPHKYDSENYSALRAYGPAFLARNENNETFLRIKFGDRDGYLSGEEYPLGLNITDGVRNAFIHDVYEADVFSKFVVKPDFDAEMFELLVDGTSLGSFGFRQSASELSRIRFQVGGWGVSGNSHVDQFRTGGSIEPTPIEKFQVLREQKVALAREIDRIGNRIEDEQVATDALDALEQGLSDGTLDYETVEQIMERLQLGENLTEFTLAGLSTRESETPEDSNTLIGRPVGTTERDFVGLLVEQAFYLVLSLLSLAAAAANNLSSSGGLEFAGKVTDKIDEIINTISTAYPWVEDKLKADMFILWDDFYELITGEDIVDEEKMFDVLVDFVDTIKNEVADYLLATTEVNPPGDSFIDEVETFHSNLGKSDVSLDGNQDVARNVADAGIDEVSHEFQEAKDALEKLDIIGYILTILGGVGSILATASLLGGITAIAIAGIVGVIGVITGVTALGVTITTIGQVLKDHRSGLEAIRTGSAPDGGF